MKVRHTANTSSSNVPDLFEICFTRKYIVFGSLALFCAGVFPFLWKQALWNNYNSAVVSRRTSGTGLDLTPLLERSKILEIDVIIQYPDQIPHGILFVGHGCSHSHTDWWPSTLKVCPECLGLPEEMAIVDMAVHEFKLAVIAISSKDRQSMCWKSTDGNRVAKVLAVVQAKLEDRQPEDSKTRMPIIAFGASSGGSFVGKYLPEAMGDTDAKYLDGFISQIAAPEPLFLNKLSKKVTNRTVAVYITMNLDTRTDYKAREIVNSLTNKSYDAKHIRLDPLPVTRSFFSDRISTISPKVSSTIAYELERSNIIDQTTKLLQEDPRRSFVWRDVIQSAYPLSNDKLVADQSPICEVMNVAYGMHEMTRDGVKDSIQYILQNIHMRM